MVGNSIFNALKRFTIPFATVSTASLMMVFHQAKAMTLSDISLQKRGILTHHYGSGLHQDGYSFMDAPKTAYKNIEYITSKLINGLDWLNNLPYSLPKLTADLLTKIYHFLSKVVLETPLFIFNNEFLKNTSLTFAAISVTIVTILTAFEALMQMFKQEHTDFKTILKRWFFAVCITGFMPFAFEHGFKFLNQISHAITQIGINGGDADGMVYGKKLGFFNTLMIILFDLTSISLLIPVCLQAGKRWYDLMCLAAISPLALTCWVFDRHRHYFDMWWGKVKSLSLVQIVYAVFLLFMGILIFGLGAIKGGIFTLFIRLLLTFGGLMRLANPPSFVTRMTGDKSDLIDSYDNTKNTLKNIRDTLTLRNLRPAQFIKDKILHVKERKLAIQHGVRYFDKNQYEKDLRKHYGRRHVKDLM